MLKWEYKDDEMHIQCEKVNGMMIMTVSVTGENTPGTALFFDMERLAGIFANQRTPQAPSQPVDPELLRNVFELKKDGHKTVFDEVLRS